MYFWKCWRDSSLYFYVFLIAAVLCMALLGIGANAAQASLAASLVVGIAALALGAAVAKEEFSDSTTQFLFTKPRSRSYFVWMAWWTGTVQLLVLAAASVIVWCTGFVAHGGSAVDAFLLFTSSKQGGAVSTIVSCLILYCLTFALTALLRNGGEGLGISFLIVMVVPSLQLLFQTRWHIYLPSVGGKIGSLPGAISYLLWTLIGLAMVGAAQWRIEYAELK